MLRFVKFFLIGSLCGAVFFTIGFGLSAGFAKAIKLAPLFGPLFGLFIAGHMQRSMRIVEFEINSSNKDPQKGLLWYSEEISQFLFEMRYSEKAEVEDFRIFHPPALYRVLCPEFRLKVETYSVTIQGSELMVKLVKEFCELEKNQTS